MEINIFLLQVELHSVQDYSLLFDQTSMFWNCFYRN